MHHSLPRPANPTPPRLPARLTQLALGITCLFAIPGSANAQENTRSEAQISSAEQVLPSVNVTASADASAAGLPPPYAGHQVARGGRVGVLGNQDVMDTPFTTTSYTQELIQNQQAQSVSDVLQNDPGVRMARGYGNFQELYIVRGFPLYSDDIAYNGLYGLLPRQYVAAELLERVEVLRGANAFLNGAAPGGSGIGGAINLLPKRAGNEPLTQLTFGTESGGQSSVAADIARRFGPDQSTGIRINAVERTGNTAIQNENRALSALTLGLDYRSRDLRLSADLGQQDHHLTQPRPSVTPSGAIPAAGDAQKNFAQSWTWSDEKETFGTLRGEYDLNASTTIWAAGGMREGKEANSLANPTVDASGNTTAYRFDNTRDDKVTTGEVGLRSKFKTGDIAHTVSISATSYELDSKNAWAMSSSFSTGSLSNVVQAAEPGTIWSGGSLSSPRLTEKTETSSLALADTLGFANERTLLTLGARSQTIEDYSYDYNSGDQTAAYKKSKLTPVAGIVFKATQQTSIYANYIEGLVKGDVAPATYGSGLPVSNAGQVMSPYVSKQKEVGVKYDSGSLGGSVAYFTTEKPSAYTQNGIFGVYGNERHRGLEFNLFGEAAHGVRLLGGLTLLEAKQIATSGGTTDGKDAIGVPHAQANLGAEWDIRSIQGLSLSARAVRTSSQYADAANTLEIPAWTRFDVGARYLTMIEGRLVTFRVRVDNLTNRNYWASAGGYPGSSYLVLGAPRTFNLSATIDF